MTTQSTQEPVSDTSEDTIPPNSINKEDRHLTTSTVAFQEALNAIDLSGLAVLELGCGEGHLLRAMRALPKEKQPKTIYAFEILTDEIGDDIREWAADEHAQPRLVLNPPEYKMNPQLQDGDFTNYDFLDMLGKEDGFAIVSNPPYFLWNRVLSLTGDYIMGDNECIALKDRFKGALGITSEARLPNHPGWIARAVLNKEDFTPVASTSNHYIIQAGFEGRYDPSQSNIPEKNRPQGFGEDAPIIGVAELRESLMQRKEEWGDGVPTRDVGASWAKRVGVASNDNRPAIPRQSNPRGAGSGSPVIYLLGDGASIAQEICRATGAEFYDSPGGNLPALPEEDFRGAVFTNGPNEDNEKSLRRFEEVRVLAESKDAPSLTVRLQRDTQVEERSFGMLEHALNLPVVDMDVSRMPAEEAAARVMLVYRCIGQALKQGVPLQELADHAASYQADAEMNVASLDEVEAAFRDTLPKMRGFSQRARPAAPQTGPSLS